MDNTEFITDSRIFIAVDSANTLEVSLPDTIEIEESSNTSITPTIESSQAIDSYQWRWLSEQSVTLLTPTNKVLNLLTPAVATDIQGQLEFTVVMANISKTVATEITIKNKEAISDVNLAASRLIAVKGQTITLDVITDNFAQIKQWSWQVSGVQGTNISESNEHFEITAPQVSGQQTMSIIYRATLIDDSEVLKIANITVFSESIALASFTFDLGTTPIIYNNIENAFTVTFADPHGLVDLMALDQSLTSNTFDKAELTRVGDQINIVLKTSTVIFDHTDFIYFNVAYGDYEQQYPMQLQMRIN
ncbi:hypothetical protein A9Q98_13545 [Thalassotalea sp. 42_200_T64]|nr:hypothetical protein A9Q98_13545 [Thalassotalea sp. 42_200_T64]